MESSSSPGSSKRPKGFDNIRPLVSCLVDGCNSDLSQCREYHRRHKVCELHSKSPNVTIGGQEQRFCQQCSRFHSLGEFDGGKRSCRKRLDGHNRRRRKPPSDTLSKSPARYLPSQQGTLLSFGTPSPQLLPSSVASSWAGPLKLDEINAIGPCYSPDNNAIGTLGHHHNFEMRNLISEQICSKPFLGPDIGYNTFRVVESARALSLLSSATTAETLGIDLGHPTVPSMRYCEVPMSSSYNAHDNIPCQTHGLFSHGPGSDGSDSMLSFKWEESRFFSP